MSLQRKLGINEYYCPLTLSGRGLKPSLGPLNGYRHIGDLMHSLSIGCKSQMPAMYASKIRISIAKIIQ